MITIILGLTTLGVLIGNKQRHSQLKPARIRKNRRTK